MIAKLKAYAEYQGSTQAWFGELPRHWSVLPNRALFGEVKDRNHPDEEMLSVTIMRGIVRQRTLLEGGSKKDSSNLDKSAYKLVQPRDIAYNKMRAWQGAIGASELRGIISPAYVVMRLRKEDSVPSYFHHLYRTPQFAKEAERWSYGITSDMWSLRPEHFKAIYTPDPPHDEQAAIVRFLNWANGRLERAIRAKRKVITLLNEQKQAIIHRAVTRGLDASIPLKPSAIDWTPEIPQDWDQYPLRRLAVCENSGSYGHDPSAGLRELPVATTAQINRDGRFDVVRMPRRGFTAAEVERFSCKAGDILVVKSSGSAANVVSGKCGIVEPDTPLFVYSNFLARFIANVSLVQPRYLFLLLTSYITRERVKRMVSTTTYPNLRMGEYRGALLPVPPMGEQQRILDAVRGEVASVEQAVSRLEREIDLLREYRTRIVSDVVTGKLDVREAATRLPEEAPPETPADDTELGDETEPADDQAAA